MLKVQQWEKEKYHSSVVFAQNLKDKIETIKTRLDRLADAYLDQAIELSEYKEKKNKLIEQKAGFEEKLRDFERKGNHWLELLKNWIKVASTLVKIARDSNLQEKKVAAKEIFGSNLRLASRAVRGEPVFPFSAALRAAESIGKIPESLILVGGTGLEPATSAM